MGEYRADTVFTVLRKDADMTESPYRAGLSPIPARLRKRPIERGYPVPWFCEKVGDHWDFRIVDGRKFRPAIDQQLCWICGGKLGGYKAFTIGPMCAINRTISEPPSHRDCATFAIRACPFLNQRESRRNAANLPDGVNAPAGDGIDRQPGVSLLWITKGYRVMQVENGILFKIGDPTAVEWFREGRPALRSEIMESIDSGYPILLAAAKEDGSAAVRELETARDRAMALLPKEST